MLHIKDIEAFARINEALNAQADGASTDDSATNEPASLEEYTAHPALVLAMIATGRLPMSALPKAVSSAKSLLPWPFPTKRP